MTSKLLITCYDIYHTSAEDGLSLRTRLAPCPPFNLTRLFLTISKLRQNVQPNPESGNTPRALLCQTNRLARAARVNTNRPGPANRGTLFDLEGKLIPLCQNPCFIDCMLRYVRRFVCGHVLRQFAC